MKQGKSNIPILIEGYTIMVFLKWYYFSEIKPTPENPYGEPYDFTYEIIWHDAPEGISEEEIMLEIDKISIFDIMDC